MAGFVYYIPGANGFADAARHIPHAIDPARAAVRGALQGPDGGRGAFFADRDAIAGDLVTDGLRWAKAPGERTWWIGVAETGPLPTPECLDRNIQLPGATVRLGDGSGWRIPTAILPRLDGTRGDSPLPKVRRLRADGTVERVVEPAWADLYLAADEVWDLFAHETPIPDDREMQIAAIALAAQYRVSTVEVSILGLLTDQATASIFCTLVAYLNWPSVRKLAEGGAP